ncbi:MAG TPA: nicotinate-nucleotide adenylyltransferase [Rhodospirillaceae bacterium]|nr:nicotinate-nucleotide adenylyltransferase [Rhodospirillaceae bacterium]
MTRPTLLTPPTLHDSQRWRGMRVGLFGGTFNPPHAGHIHASDIAMKYLGLDAIWWLVTPGNPLKNKSNLPDLPTRIAHCRQLVTNPRVLVTDLERDLGTVRTYDTVKALQSRFPATDFIWFSGTDIAYEFHRWYKWRELQSLLPFAFIGRPHQSGQVRQNAFRQNQALHHHYPLRGMRPPLTKGTIYWIFAEPLLDISSSQLRDSSQGNISQFAKNDEKG